MLQVLRSWVLQCVLDADMVHKFNWFHPFMNPTFRKGLIIIMTNSWTSVDQAGSHGKAGPQVACCSTPSLLQSETEIHVQMGEPGWCWSNLGTLSGTYLTLWTKANYSNGSHNRGATKYNIQPYHCHRTNTTLAIVYGVEYILKPWEPCEHPPEVLLWAHLPPWPPMRWLPSRRGLPHKNEPFETGIPRWKTLKNAFWSTTCQQLSTRSSCGWSDFSVCNGLITSREL